jgi:hypothetical protein
MVSGGDADPNRSADVRIGLSLIASERKSNNIHDVAFPQAQTVRETLGR